MLWEMVWIGECRDACKARGESEEVVLGERGEKSGVLEVFEARSLGLRSEKEWCLERLSVEARGAVEVWSGGRA